MKNLGAWMRAYTDNLVECLSVHGSDYVWGFRDLDMVTDRMARAFEMGTYNKEGRALKLTCKHFGIPCTYTAINTFLRGI